MSLDAPAADQEIAWTTEVSFETLHQHRLFKPTHVYRYADIPATQWWHKAIGLTHSAYYHKYRLGAVLTYLAVDVFDVALMPQDPITVRFKTLLGRYAFAPEKPPRYGGLDALALVTADGREAARLTSFWLWFRTPEEGKPGTIAEPPPLFPHSDRLFDAHSQAPAFAGTPAGEFCWTRRETDLNQHVNSLSFLERAENALTDAGVNVPPTGRFEIWYQKPGFAGQRTAAFWERAAAGVQVRLVNAETGQPMTVLKFPA